MDERKPRSRWGRWRVRAGLLFSVLLPGCCCLDSCWDCGAAIPPGAIPPLTGTHARAITHTQAMLAEADDFVIYDHEWTDCASSNLNLLGQRHFNKIVKRLPDAPFPVLVQAVPDAMVNEARRNAVVQNLAIAGVPDPDVRVVVGQQEAEGLDGFEAVQVYRQGFMELFRRRTNQGQSVRPSGGGSGWFGGLGGWGGGW
jgi:hypothetical protein